MEPLHISVKKTSTNFWETREVFASAVPLYLITDLARYLVRAVLQTVTTAHILSLIPLRVVAFIVKFSAILLRNLPEGVAKEDANTTTQNTERANTVIFHQHQFQRISFICDYS